MLRQWVSAAALAGGVLSGVALATPPEISVAAGGSPALEPGSTAAVSWTAALDVREFGEMELLLSVDGGRTFPVRVTRRIAPTDRGFSWTVPALPSAHARLALRAGVDEDAEEETIVAVSGEFAIAASPGGAEELFRVGGEERTRDALEDLPPPSLPDSLSDRGPTLLACVDAIELAEGPHTLDSGAGLDRASRSPAAPTPHTALRPILRAGPSALLLPLRL